MPPIISIEDLSKTYASGFEALKHVDLTIEEGEILALLGPNANALSHEPTILFLDEPTAGADVALRRDMWNMVRGLRENGVTVILTTHYIEEAEEMADRVGVISEGKSIW